jgi:dCMP deaminase
MLGSGYNGFPRFVNDDPLRYADRETKLRMVVHAEVNAILNATKLVVGSTLISTRAPCTGCVGIIIQSGISDVICPDQAANSRWADDWEIAKGMLEEAGVTKTYATLPDLTRNTFFSASDDERLVLIRSTCPDCGTPNSRGCGCGGDA